MTHQGQLNENICANSLFYYESVNITESQLAFRAPGNREKLGQRLNYQQYGYGSIEKFFAIRSGRRVQSFRSEDLTKLGYNKIAAMFSVAPVTSVMSTTNVPPQKKHRFTSQVQDQATIEVVEIMILSLDDEAKKLREELMAEKTVLSKTVDNELRQVTWSSCEH
ncbi:hypothetical protein CORC01_01452 [Colletotrichum orchidophilum]|uniref:DUF4246 domain-containing protein n=1 Tax=Colletotrichum orchidophilum TaxID=1209926 RepID=A0A1G4BP36_9PEZI|nr:uncharacterized protein CORC01_01452 [Colletotrichum orchidophilum]OHF03068.1 hypothetical protein CORC01_01452 [Colletotrichum orchidophilum]